jgi:hypothetical protein
VPQGQKNIYTSGCINSQALLYAVGEARIMSNAGHPRAVNR